MTLESAYQILYSAALIGFAALIGAMVVRSIIGPRVTDRILSINMVGTMVICCIAILSRMLKEGFLLDVALIYAMISFIAVLVLATVYIPADAREKDVKERIRKALAEKESGEGESRPKVRKDRPDLRRGANSPGHGHPKARGAADVRETRGGGEK